MKLIFMGTPDFAVPVLEELIERGHEVGYVVTQPDRAGNRGKITCSPVKEAAVEHGIETLQPERLSKACQEKGKMRAFAPDAIVVVAYGQILNDEILSMPELGCFNVHASLLPRFRGAAPMQHAILSGEEKTGITIMRMDEGLDTGDMVAKEETYIGGKNFKDIHDELSRMGARLMADTLPRIESGESEYTPQNSEEATYAPKLTKADGKIDFGGRAGDLNRQIRAFDPWPGAFCDYKNTKLKIWNAEAVTCEPPVEPSAGRAVCDKVQTGVIVKVNKDGIYVSCGEGMLKITELQLPGKRRMSVSDFIKGNSIEKGDILN